MTNKPVELLVIGGSAGSLEVLLRVLPLLHKDLPLSLVIVLHRKSTSDTSLIDLLSAKTALNVKEAEEKEPILPGNIYIAPADYHLLIEADRTLSLDYSEKINFSRPCIDVTFQSAAEVYGKKLACLLLSGANADGVEGLKAVKKLGGITAVQNPDTAEVSFMPQQAVEQTQPDYVLDINNIADFINLSAKTSS